MKKFKSSRLFKSFEINQSRLSTVVGGGPIGGGGSAGTGGTYEESTSYSDYGNPACTPSCPDALIDIRSSDSGVLVGTR
jgi:hypothetical protein